MNIRMIGWNILINLALQAWFKLFLSFKNKFPLHLYFPTNYLYPGISHAKVTLTKVEKSTLADNLHC